VENSPQNIRGYAAIFTVLRRLLRRVEYICESNHGRDHIQQQQQSVEMIASVFFANDRDYNNNETRID